MIEKLKIIAQNIDLGEIDIPNRGDVSDNTVENVMRLVFALAGAIAFLVIIVAGVQFILSRGDPQKSATARSAIIYALVGLVVAVLAFTIVGLVAGELG